MWIIIAMIALGVFLETLFFAMMWPPWRSEFPSMAWLLVSTSGALVLYDGMILLATLQIHVPPIPALLILLVKDVLLSWRVKIILRSRRPAKHKSRHRKAAKMNPLFDIIPAKGRKYVYALVGLAALVWGAWQAADGDWKVVVGSVVTALVAGLAHANVQPTKAEEDSTDSLDSGAY